MAIRLFEPATHRPPDYVALRLAARGIPRQIPEYVDERPAQPTTLCRIRSALEWSRTRRLLEWRCHLLPPDDVVDPRRSAPQPATYAHAGRQVLSCAGNVRPRHKPMALSSNSPRMQWVCACGASKRGANDQEQTYGASEPSGLQEMRMHILKLLKTTLRKQHARSGV